MKKFIKENILAIIILLVLLSNITLGVFQIILLYQIKDLTGMPYSVELRLEQIYNTNRSIESELKSLYRRF